MAPLAPRHPHPVAGAVGGDPGGRGDAAAGPLVGRDKPIGRAHRKPLRLILALALAGAVLPASVTAPGAAALRFCVDDWITECGTAGCSITGLFQQTNLDGRRGAFALVIMLGSRQLAVVGDPFPSRARLQIDANNPTACVGARYCVFPGYEAARAIRELSAGSLVLIDVYAGKEVFRSSLSTQGYRASLAKLQAEGYKVPAI